MADINTELPDVEPHEGAVEAAVKGTSCRKSFAKLRRELSDEELSSPAVQRMLIDEIERLDAERVELNQFRTRFHESDKRVGVLEERFKTKIAIEIIHVGCITVGAAALGYLPSVLNQGATAWMIAIFGSILVVAGLVAKAVKP